ncbi:MAG: hypothetical protein E7573_01170 [Ruminococcaceae bacterium]|nr:hypothetical protein [Oscillospiraceae bacterium]MBR3598163.1 dockerin type I repeat-containing protein [Clostridia bacterium]
MKRQILKTLFITVLSLSALFILTFGASAAIKGDVSGDKAVTSEDARTVLRAAVSIEQLSPEAEKIGDVDEDGTISAADARDILRMSVGLEDIEHFYEKELIKEATCTEKAVYLRTCTECDDVYEEEDKALGHDYPAPEILTAVTCETDGLEKYTCNRCGESEDVVVPAGHIWVPSKATCTEDQYCTRGNHIGDPAFGHTTTWGKCGTCKIFVTDKYTEQAQIIKTNCTAAVKDGETAYALIQQSVGSAYTLKSFASKAKPYYERAKQAYQAAFDACADIPEFAAIKTQLSSLITNTDKITAQLAVISSVGSVDSSNYFDLIAPIDTPQWANERITPNLIKNILW